MRLLRTPLRTVEELKDNIREEIAAIPAEMLAKTMENAAKKAQNAINDRGGHLRDRSTWNKLND